MSKLQPSMSAEPQEAPNEQNAKDRKLKPTKYLLTERIEFFRQLEMLRAFVAATMQGGRPASEVEVAKILEIVPSTVSMGSAIFTDVGFLQKSESRFTPAIEVINYSNAYGWNADTAPQKLAPLLERSWFMQVLLPRLSFRALSEDDAVTVLAEAASAGREYKNQLVLLLDYLSAAGLIAREGGEVRLVKSSAQQSGRTSVDEVQAPKVTETRDSPQAKTAAASPSGGSQFTGGAVQFHVSVRVDMDEFADWEPARIQAFFAGIAQVLAAKKALVGVDGSQG